MEALLGGAVCEAGDRWDTFFGQRLSCSCYGACLVGLKVPHGVWGLRFEYEDKLKLMPLLKTLPLAPPLFNQCWPENMPTNCFKSFVIGSALQVAHRCKACPQAILMRTLQQFSMPTPSPLLLLLPFLLLWCLYPELLVAPLIGRATVLNVPRCRCHLLCPTKPARSDLYRLTEHSV